MLPITEGHGWAASSQASPHCESPCHFPPEQGPPGIDGKDGTPGTPGMKVGVGTTSGLGARVRAPPSQASDPEMLKGVPDTFLLATEPQFLCLHLGGSHGHSGWSFHCASGSLLQGSAGQAGRPGNPGHQGLAVSLVWIHGGGHVVCHPLPLPTSPRWREWLMRSKSHTWGSGRVP